MIELESVSDRGFVGGKFKDTYGRTCSIQESSIAIEPRIWLGCEPRMHLNKSMAVDLVMHLQRFIETGKLR